MLLQLLHKMTSWTDSIMNIVHALGKNLSCHKVPIDQAWHDIDVSFLIIISWQHIAIQQK